MSAVDKHVQVTADRAGFVAHVAIQARPGFARGPRARRALCGAEMGSCSTPPQYSRSTPRTWSVMAGVAAMTKKVIAGGRDDATQARPGPGLLQPRRGHFAPVRHVETVVVTGPVRFSTARAMSTISREDHRQSRGRSSLISLTDQRGRIRPSGPCVGPLVVFHEYGSRDSFAWTMRRSLRSRRYLQPACAPPRAGGARRGRGIRGPAAIRPPVSRRPVPHTAVRQRGGRDEPPDKLAIRRAPTPAARNRQP